MDGVWARGTAGAHASRWQAPAGRPLHTEAAGLQDGPTAMHWDEQRAAAGPILAVAEQQLCEDLHRHLTLDSAGPGLYSLAAAAARGSEPAPSCGTPSASPAATPMLRSLSSSSSLAGSGAPMGGRVPRAAVPGVPGASPFQLVGEPGVQGAQQHLQPAQQQREGAWELHQPQRPAVPGREPGRQQQQQQPLEPWLWQQAESPTRRQQQHQPPQEEEWSSIFIKGCPEEADKLWLYEKFARFGAVHSVRILVDEQTGTCNGVGYVNYLDAGAACKAADGMNGVRQGGRLLHVMVQRDTHASLQRRHHHQHYYQHAPPGAMLRARHGALPGRRPPAASGGAARRSNSLEQQQQVPRVPQQQPPLQAYTLPHPHHVLPHLPQQPQQERVVPAAVMQAVLAAMAGSPTASQQF